MKEKEDLLVIVGPTAVGKTALSLQLAESFRGEIISGDSMQVYRYMDIGTAKATPAERARVPHHMIDIVDPDYPFSVDEFQRMVKEKIREIQSRGNLPMLVGGTGLYVQSVTHGYQLPGVKEDPAFREEMHRLADEQGNEALHRRLAKVDPETASRLHPNDRRRIIRALEVFHAKGVPFSHLQKQEGSLYNTLWIGLTMPREQLYERINRRVDQMMADGLVEEVKRLRALGYRGDLTSMQALGYKEIQQYLDGRWTLEEAVEAIKRGTRKFAKRQLSWFRRLKEIRWFDVTRPGFTEEIHQVVAGKFPGYSE
ncbi:tRNA (adenosine(37)-N6)-dimethylallyltransferase MiaA [Polycladomyces subterraneus]|uniref:tRNA dimethylallyltransferase n=1 Tax=Polycladomyces subterraneus TaxID=1016997 RepID=A0ABT8IM94_9BACL|nr:tRNA (adenosine(37)-N6)-dimethylallyltransferase MiaA [Polycladomyces subterraneus]MDN4593845.1 tRNA (adenosine(37)-N6)-dimethylallyltransferase MiaA [Polycladomyces subterraneus]